MPSIPQSELGPDPLLIHKPYTPGKVAGTPIETPATPPVVPAPTPIEAVAEVHVAHRPRPSHTVTNQNVVVQRGGAGAGKQVTIKRRMGGRNVQSVTTSNGTSSGGVIQTHHPIFHDADGVEHISLDGKTFRKLEHCQHLNIVRRETVKRGK